MLALFEFILPVFLVIGFGYVVAWRGIFSEASVDGLVKFTQNFAIPCLLFRAISEIDIDAATKGPMLVSFYLGAFASFFAGFAGARLVFARSPEDAVAIGFCCLFSNTVLLGIPIAELAYGPEALANNFAIIAFHAPLCYLLGVTAMEVVRGSASSTPEKAARIFRAMFRNPFVIGIALGLVVNLTGLALPVPLVSALDLVAGAALPAALFGLGGVLFQYRPEGDFRTIAMVCAISLVLHPAIVWTTAQAFDLGRDQLRSAVLTAAMAPGVNAYLFANLYGTARRVAASSVLIATAASVVTIWLWMIVLG